MVYYRLLFLICLTSYQMGFGQIDSLVNSGIQLEKAKILSDSGLYDLAIEELKRIEPRDTNYQKSLSELADVYLSKHQYQDAIETAQLGLRQVSSYRSNFLLIQGMAYTQLGEYAKATVTFDAGIKEFPFYTPFLLQKGKMYYAQAAYSEAERLFFQALELSPFNSISHLHLGIISMLRGEKVRGMMAMGIYLAINNTSNKQLVILERFVKNELTDEYTVPPAAENAFTRLDGIIRSRIAMEEDYKTRIPIDAGVVKQYQLMFDQLALQEYTSNDPWITYYLPVYKQLIKSNLQDAFVYHILQSTTIKQVPQWTKNNQSTLDAFYNVVNSTLKLHREKKVLSALGYKETVFCWYDDYSRLESIGNKNSNDQPVGRWYHYFNNGVMQASGEYDNQGNKKGIWKYYNESGYLTTIENYETGLRERFTQQGKPWQRYYLRNNQVDGEAIIYYDCGVVNEQLNYSNSMRNGPGNVFAIDGTELERFTFLNDSLQGKYESFFVTGEKQVLCYYDRGKLTGTYTRYHPNGMVNSQTDYNIGKATGKTKFYYDNGQVSEEGQYHDDNPVGEFRYYDRKGRLTEIRNYNNEGKVHGENTFYDQGILYCKLINENGRMIAATYVNTTGKEIATYKEVNGDMTGRSHFPTGEVRSEYTYKDGKATGVWKYYDRSGYLNSEYPHVNDEIHGQVVEYYPNNKVKVKLFYNKGKKHGPFEEFFSNGKLQAQGWYQDGLAQQRWLHYHPNGKIRSDEYFLNNQQVGSGYYYSQTGNLYISIEMMDDKIVEYKIFNEQGEPISSAILNKNNVEVVARFKSGREFQHMEILCGRMAGKSSILFPDGMQFRTTQYRNGKLHGLSEHAGAFGEPMSMGNNVDGNSEGRWVWYYPNGVKETIGSYLNDERDSVWTYYYENGTISQLNSYENGKREGISKVFGPDGQLILEKKYNQGDIIAYRVPTGSNEEWVTFSGTGLIKATYPNGKPSLEAHYDKGTLHGVQKIYYSSGKLFTHFNFDYGNQEGQQIVYYPDGKVRSTRNYTMDNEIGRCEWYDATGKIERVEQYESGYLNGVSTLYQSGKKVKEVKFWYGLPID